MRTFRTLIMCMYIYKLKSFMIYEVLHAKRYAFRWIGIDAVFDLYCSRTSVIKQM